MGVFAVLQAFAGTIHGRFAFRVGGVRAIPGSKRLRWPLCRNGDAMRRANRPRWRPREGSRNGRCTRGVDGFAAGHDNARADGRAACDGTVLHQPRPWTYTLVAPPASACIGWRRPQSNRSAATAPGRLAPAST